MYGDFENSADSQPQTWEERMVLRCLMVFVYCKMLQGERH